MRRLGRAIPLQWGGDEFGRGGQIGRLWLPMGQEVTGIRRNCRNSEREF